MDYRQAALDVAARYGIPQHLFLSQIKQESGFNPNAVSPAGAIGLGQLMPGTAKELGVDPYDPGQNLDGAARYLKQQYDRFGDWNLALAAYNAGPGAVTKYGGIPPYKETQGYVSAIMGQDSPAAVASDTMRALGKERPMDGLLSTQNLAPQQEEQRPPFGERLREGFKSGSFWDALAMGANAMRQRPDPGLAQMVGQRVAERRGAQTRNKTAQWLQQRGRPDLAEALMTGALDAKSAVAMAYQQPDRTKGIEIDGRLVNPYTGEVMADFSTGGGVDPKDARDARKEFTGLPVVKDFATQSAAFGRVIASAEDPSPAGDLALIFNYMKVLDPNSVVRESEFATAAKAGSYGERVKAAIEQVESGKRLTEAQRTDFVKRSERLYQDAERQYNAVRDQWVGYAETAGQDPTQVVPDFAYRGRNAPERSQRPAGRPEGLETARKMPTYTQDQLKSAMDQLSPYDLQLLSSIPSAQGKIDFLRQRGVLQ